MLAHGDLLPKINTARFPKSGKKSADKMAEGLGGFEPKTWGIMMSKRAAVAMKRCITRRGS